MLTCFEFSRRSLFWLKSEENGPPGPGPGGGPFLGSDLELILACFEAIFIKSLKVSSRSLALIKNSSGLSVL